MSFPASHVSHDTATIAHANNVVYYNRVAEDNLKPNLPFLSVCTRRKLPSKNGKTIRLFQYDVLAANTTPGSEGVNPAPIKVPSVTRDLTVSQYFDHVSVSDFLLDQVIDDHVENISEELGFRAALTVNKICQTAIDLEGVADATIVRVTGAEGEYMSAATARRLVMSLRSRNAKAHDGEWFYGIIHPLAAYDLLSDNTNGGTIDVLKHVDSGVNEMKNGIRGNRVLNLNGIRWVETTTTGTTADVPSSSDTAYHSYVFAKDAFFCASLGKTEVKEKNFSLMIGRYSGPSPSNPVGAIAATIGYNFKFGIVKTTGSVNKFRLARYESSIT